ncbi:MAG TPA: SPW repeat protein [Baekduia sp.]|nr:SPW repeat protein [Baekduia sp.]
MIRQGPISLALHAALEPLVAGLLVAAPFLFGFSDQGAPTTASIVIGIAVLVVGMSTRWRISLVKAIPVGIHAVLDLVVAALLIISPFLFGFSDQSAPTAFFLVMGVVVLLEALATRWSGATPRRGRAPAQGPPRPSPR